MYIPFVRSLEQCTPTRIFGDVNASIVASPLRSSRRVRGVVRRR
jgi:hypothetical protein